MDKKHRLARRWLFGIAVLVTAAGLLGTAWILFNSGIAKYPALIGAAFREEQYKLRIPGSKDVNLTRTGAYGIYYEYNPETSEPESLEMPPRIDCSLTAKSTGALSKAVPDFVETNRYATGDRGIQGVLIMSITVDNPDVYTFTCEYQEKSLDPEIVVALGPNYFWEFLNVAWKSGISLFGAAIVFCGSILVAVVLFLIGTITGF